MSQEASKLPIWTCDLRLLSDADAVQALMGITVGQRFELNCSGPEQEFPKSTTEIHLGEGTYSQYFLVPLKRIKESSTNFTYEVTSYQPGEFPGNTPLIFKKGNTSVELQGFKWQVVTSIKSDGEGQMQQQPTPYPHYGAAPSELPTWQIFVVLLGLLGVVLLGFGVFKRFQKRKIDFKNIEDIRTARKPLDELFYRIQRISRGYNFKSGSTESFAIELNTAFTQYLSTELNVPAYVWSRGRTMRYLKRKKRRLYKVHGDRIKRVTYELGLAQKKKQLEEKDCRQLLELCKDTANLVSDFNETGGRKW